MILLLVLNSTILVSKNGKSSLYRKTAIVYCPLNRVFYTKFVCLKLKNSRKVFEEIGFRADQFAQC